MMMVVQLLNEKLGQPNSESYNQAKAIVQKLTTTTVAQAVEESGVYAELEARYANQVTEAKLVFPKLTPSVNAAILAALRDAFSRGASVSLGWIELEDGPMHAHVHENTNGDRVVIQLSCPRGNVLTAPPRPDPTS